MDIKIKKRKPATLSIVKEAYQDAMDYLYSARTAETDAQKKYSIHYNERSGVLTVRGKPFTFRGKTAKMLKYFFRHEHVLLSYGDIIFEIWGEYPASETSKKRLQQLISAFKKRTGLSENELIINRGSGYMLSTI